MANDVYREAVVPEKIENTVPQKSGDGAGVQVTDVDVPYTEYSKENNHPYIVDHFELGDTWAEKLEEFLEKESLTIALMPQFGLGDDGRIIFKGSIQVSKKQ